MFVAVGRLVGMGWRFWIVFGMGGLWWSWLPVVCHPVATVIVWFVVGVVVVCDVFAFCNCCA